MHAAPPCSIEQRLLPPRRNRKLGLPTNRSGLVAWRRSRHRLSQKLRRSRHRLSQKLILSFQISYMTTKTCDFRRIVIRRWLTTFNSDAPCTFFGYPFAENLLIKAELTSLRFNGLTGIYHDAGSTTTILLGESTMLSHLNIFPQDLLVLLV